MLIGQKMDKSLIGIGGVRLLRVPGVQHDRKVVLPAPGMNQDTGEPYDEVPADSISTREASQLLKCTSLRRARYWYAVGWRDTLCGGHRAGWKVIGRGKRWSGWRN